MSDARDYDNNEIPKKVEQQPRLKPLPKRNPDLPSKDIVKKVAMVTWEDIMSYSRVEIPDDFEFFRLSKVTVGLLWRESQDYVVLVQDYDVSNRGKDFRHNDFHIIPRGVIKNIDILGEVRF